MRRQGLEALGEGVEVKNVDAHVGQGAGRLFGLLQELRHPAVFIGQHNAEAAGFLGQHVHHGNGQVGAALFVLAQHRPVVHLVDVIARQDEHRFGPALAQIIQVLEHRVGRAAVPVLVAAALIGLEQAHAPAAAVEIPRPADADVVVERAGQVLRQDADVVDAGVDAVGQGEVNDAKAAGERHGRLGALLREHAQAGAGAAGQDESDNAHKGLP